MSVFNALLYATTANPGEEETILNPFGRLMDAPRPFWLMKVQGKYFRFFADKTHFLENAIWQLLDYCSVTSDTLSMLPEDEDPCELEDVLGADYCYTRRKILTEDLLKSSFSIKLYTWPGCEGDETASVVTRLQEAGVSIVHFAFPEQYRPVIDFNEFEK